MKKKSAPIKVLIADGYSIVRDGLHSLLEQHDDLRVVGAMNDGPETLAAVERLTPHVVIVALGVRMSEGLEALRAIAQKKPDIAVIVLSMHDSSVVIERALQAGARGYLTRHSGGDELVKAVREVAAGKRYIAGNLADKVFETLRRRAPSALEELTSTEHDILRLVADGKSNAEVGAQLRLATRTVETYRIRLMRKLNLDDLASLVKFAIRHGITSLD
ncbi:MAG TPA: response regulator transcription factor [Burkholderiales bacterium]